MRLKVFSGLPSVVLNAKVVDQGGAARVDQEIEDGEELVLTDQDQGGADCLQEPVDHVASH